MRVLDGRAELLGAVAERCGFRPVLHVGTKILKLAVVGIKPHPAFRHLDEVRRFAGLHHAEELFEGLAPGQRDDLDLDVRVGFLEFRELAFEEFGALRAGDHFHQLHLGFGPGRSGAERGKGRSQQDRRRSVSSFFPPLGFDTCDKGFLQVGPEHLGILEADMQADGAWRHAETVE